MLMDDYIKEKTKQLLEHEHPLHLIDLWSEQLKHEEEHEEDEEENEDELIAKQAFRCLCFRCEEEINWFHRYYYTCSQCDEYSIHKFCMEFTERYYTHLDCATSRNEPFMSILAAPDAGKTIKNYKDVEHPDVVHLPFPDPSYSILKHWFFKEDGSSKFEVNKDTGNSRISHQHPLILEDARCTDITSSSSTPSRMKRISYHDPMKRIELLCNGCLRPITTAPIYVCANEDEHCNFALHEWCSRLPTEVKDHWCHPQHTLILHSKAPNKFFGVFDCDICALPCNGFAYCCEECEYYIDVNCAFLPKEVTHTCHPNHLFSLFYEKKRNYFCRVCKYGNWAKKFISFSCYNCDIHLHPQCALLIPETTTHKCDKHPLKLSFLPSENHKSEYFCEICEEEFDPEYSFYHCNECMQSMHLACAPSIIRYETCPGTYDFKGIYEFVNVKFEGTYSNTKLHQHPLSFIQGVESDGRCDKCGDPLRYNMIFKCLHCKFAVHLNCHRRLDNRSRRLDN